MPLQPKPQLLPALKPGMHLRQPRHLELVLGMQLRVTRPKVCAKP